jgi:hypothetical protein
MSSLHCARAYAHPRGRASAETLGIVTPFRGNGRRPVSTATVLVGLLAAAACAEPLEFPTWTVPVPEGARVIGYAAATAAEREGGRIEFVEDLVIAPRGDDLNYAFYQSGDVKADDEGRIYVLDGGNHRIQVFDADGEYLHSLGKEGGGPGEFRSIAGFSQMRLVVASDRVIVYDGMLSKIATWDMDGNHLGDVSTSGTRFIDLLAGLPGGSIVAVVRVNEEREGVEDASSRTVGAFSTRGQIERAYVNLPYPGNFQIGRVGLAPLTGSPLFAATPDGVFATTGDEYQVLAFDADGSPRWALRVAHERAPFTDAHRDDILAMLRSNFADLDVSGTGAQWPQRVGSISHLFVDGHGHLYVTGFVVPFVPAPENLEVDAFSPEGDRLFVGSMPNLRWTDARGDFVYGLRTNEATGEQEPVRYRLIEPF